MKLQLALGLALSFVATLPVSPALANDDEEATPAQLLIDLRDDTNDADERAVEAELGGIDIRLNSIHSGDERFFIADVDPSDLDRLIAAIKNDPRVENVEPNYIYAIPEPSELEAGAFDGFDNPIDHQDGEIKAPNDPLWDRQWSFRMIDAPRAWTKADGKGVVVAVIDTGVAFEDHKSFRRVEDLSGIEFVKPYDFVADTNHANDDHGHGTHVAGTIAQATNNKVGVAGLAHRAKIMPLKVLNKAGMGTAADIADAIRYAADEGANVINMSLGGGGRSATMESAVAYARKKGVVVVCAAGNGSRGRVEFPAAYPGAFAVSSVGPDKKLAFYSSWGKELAISAPGGDKQKGGDAGAIVQNTIVPNNVGLTNMYLAFQGTSMAAPHVAGVAALIMSAGVTNASKVEEILKSTAEDAGDKGWDERYGAGIVNAGRAVQSAKDASGGLSYFLAGLGSLLVFALRFGRRAAKLKPGLIGVIATILASSGLWFLERIGLAGVPGVHVLSTAMPAWDGAIFGASWLYTAFWASAIPLYVATVLLLGSKKLRGLLGGLAIGWAAHLLVTAVLMPADVQLIPGLASIFDRVWLVLNAGALLFLARIIARVQSKSAA